jgi:hypothetical protein
MQRHPVRNGMRRLLPALDTQASRVYYVECRCIQALNNGGSGKYNRRGTMSATQRVAVVALILAIGLAGVQPAVGRTAIDASGGGVTVVPAGNAFTYQGYLTDGGSPANGPYDFTFGLYADAAGTQWVTDAAPVGDLPVVNGLFTALVDLTDSMYGDIHFYLNGEARYLKIGVRPGASTGAYTYLWPLQALTPVPYAQALPGLHTVQNDVSPNVVGGYPWNSVNVNAVGGAIGGGGRSTNMNSVTDDYGTVSGGQGNTAGQEAAVGGGVDNTANGWQAAIGGGGGNSAAGTQAAIAGGGGNVAAGQWAAIGGGDVNYANATASTVVGGEGNTADGLYATVGGGRSNYAGGDYSFAAGRRAKAYNHGSFVWADSTDADFSSSNTNQFRVRATNGAEFIANSTGYGARFENGNASGDGVRAYGNVSNGNNYAALYAFNTGTSPAVYANTTAGTYAGYFADPIYVNGGCIGCILVYIARNDGAEALEMGDVVAATGVEDPLAGSVSPVLRVRLAGQGLGVAGVVLGRAEVSRETKEGQALDTATRAAGPAAAGDYLFVVVQGIAQVKADASAGPIAPGARLAAADSAGHARALRSRMLDGMLVVEGAPSIGIALGPLDAGYGLIPVLVTLR